MTMTTTNTPLVQEDYGADAGLGTGGLSLNEQRLPFLSILHMSSPQCLRGHEKYIAGAQAGMFYNTATQEVYDGDEGVEFICAWREKVYTAWLPRDDGGGFRGVFPATEPMVLRAIQENVQRLGNRGRFGKIPYYASEEGENWEFVEQWNMGMIYAPTLDPDTAQRAIMAFTSTRIRPFINWVQNANNKGIVNTPRGRQQLPVWALRWRLTTMSMTTKKGSWFNPVFTAAEPGSVAANTLLPSNPLYALGKEFYDLWAGNQLDTSYEEAEEDSGPEPVVNF